jgi:hypothetical protein
MLIVSVEYRVANVAQHAGMSIRCTAFAFS